MIVIFAYEFRMLFVVRFVQEEQVFPPPQGEQISKLIITPRLLGLLLICLEDAINVTVVVAMKIESCVVIMT